MHIAFINSEYPSLSGTGHGGIATYTYTIARALAKQGHSVHILARKGTVADPLPHPIRFHFFEFMTSSTPGCYIDRLRPGEIVWEQGHARHIRDLLLSIHREYRLDVAEIPEYGGLAYHCTPPLPFPIVINFHTPSVLVDRFNNTLVTGKRRRWYRFERNALQRASAFRSPSEALRRIVCKEYAIPESNVTVIGNPVSTEPFDTIKKVRSADRLDILFAGRLEVRKGAEVLLRGLKRILQIDSRINITFAGETELGDALCYHHAIERTLSDAERERVWFLGPLPCQKLSLLYCRSTLFLFPSVFENAPYALFEAISAKLPVVATRAEGITEIIEHNETGLLFSPGNVDEMVAHIRQIIECPQTGKQLAEKAYHKIKTRYAPDRITTQLISFYEALVRK